MDVLVLFIFTSNLFFLFIVIYNFFSQIDLLVKNNELDVVTSKISILIPLRNEEDNITECLKNVYNQKLANFEVICYDDQSTDRTAEILSDLSNKYKNLKILRGEAPPSSWTGKNWACYQLANQANGDYFVFIDADVRLKERSVSSAIHKMKKLNISMLSVFPTQIMNSLGEYFIVPLMNWLLLSFLPLKFVFRFSNTAFVAANGQFIVFKKQEYFKIGGHFSVKDKIVEDMELARLMKKNRYKIATFLGSNLIFARMYKNFNDALNGFSKNFFPGFNTGVFQFSSLLMMIFFIYVLPFFLVFIDARFLFIVLLIFLQKLLISFKSKQNASINLTITPIQMILVIFIGIRSMILTKSGKVIWKGRKINLKD